MTIERERRFLVKDPISAILEAKDRVEIRQWYLSTKPAIRVRWSGGKYVLTSKQRINRSSTSEVEIELSGPSAYELLTNAIGSVEKTRLRVGDWEVDVFKGPNQGLIIAEYEMEEDEKEEDLVKPEWLGKEITGVRKYANSQLAIKPFKKWGKK